MVDKMFWNQTTKALSLRWDVAIEINWLIKETPLALKKQMGTFDLSW